MLCSLYLGNTYGVVPRLNMSIIINMISAQDFAVAELRSMHGVSVWITALNVGAVALWTVGVFAALYAGFLDPTVRVTSSTLSSIINGGATVLMAIFIDPHRSGMTDDVIEGQVSESQFRKAVVWLVGSRFAGTLLAQILLVPSATLIAYVARAL
jgi:hypothetical protein